METVLASKEEIGREAGRYFGNGYHCGETVVRTVLDALGQDGALAAVYATPFGGGFGKTEQEACGALSGALIAIGHFWGRRESGPDWDTASRLAAEIRSKFVDRHGTSQCAALCQRFGQEEQMERCGELVRNAAVALFDVMVREGAGVR